MLYTAFLFIYIASLPPPWIFKLPSPNLNPADAPAQVFLMSFSYMHADRRTYIYPPLDKRYSPIISSICGPNNMY